MVVSFFEINAKQAMGRRICSVGHLSLEGIQLSVDCLYWSYVDSTGAKRRSRLITVSSHDEYRILSINECGWHPVVSNHCQTATNTVKCFVVYSFVLFVTRPVVISSLVSVVTKPKTTRLTTLQVVDFSLLPHYRGSETLNLRKRCYLAVFVL